MMTIILTLIVAVAAVNLVSTLVMVATIAADSHCGASRRIMKSS